MICRHCGMETGTRRHHPFNYQCVRALKAAQEQLEAEAANVRLALSSLHTMTESLKDGFRYEETEIFRKVSKVLQGDFGKTFLDLYIEERDARERSSKALRSVANSLDRYCDHSLPYEQMVSEAAKKIAEHVALLGGAHLTLAGCQDNWKDAEKMRHLAELMSRMLETTRRLK